MSGALTTVIDPLDLTQALIRCPSVTPQEGGALDLLEETLTGLGFRCTRLPFAERGTETVDNLYARLGTGSPNFCFAGHTDVVPVGRSEAWRVDPFSAEVVDGHLLGRGASDMKGAIAAFVTAAQRFTASRGTEFGGAISMLITGDEEGPAVNGTKKVLEWLKERGERLDACLVGEPTCPETLGDMIKIGRRGSLNAVLTVHGVQGHAAYPQLADNPIDKMVRMLDRLISKPLDDGSEHFPATTLALTSIDVGNTATNVIPAQAKAAFNIRFNDLHQSDDLITWLHETLEDVGGEFELTVKVSGESFLTPPGPLVDVVSGAVRTVTNQVPRLSTTGGTSDARFIKDHCPVVEFGMVGATMHQVDERVPVADIETLASIYTEVLERFFSGAE